MCVCVGGGGGGDSPESGKELVHFSHNKGGEEFWLSRRLRGEGQGAEGEQSAPGERGEGTITSHTHSQL